MLSMFPTQSILKTSYKGMLTFEKHVHFLRCLFICILKATETHLPSSVKNVSLLVKFFI